MTMLWSVSVWGVKSILNTMQRRACSIVIG
jgi:hypothetical protein